MRASCSKRRRRSASRRDRARQDLDRDLAAEPSRRGHGTPRPCPRRRAARGSRTARDGRPGRVSCAVGAWRHSSRRTRGRERVRNHVRKRLVAPWLHRVSCRHGDHVARPVGRPARAAGPPRARPCAALPRRTLRRPLLRGGHLDRDLLPSGLPGPEPEGRERALLPERGRGRGRRLPPVPALPAGGRTGHTGLARDVGGRAARARADPRRRARRRARSTRSRPGSASVRATCTGCSSRTSAPRRSRSPRRAGCTSRSG